MQVRIDDVIVEPPVMFGVTILTHTAEVGPGDGYAIYAHTLAGKIISQLRVTQSLGDVPRQGWKR